MAMGEPMRAQPPGGDDRYLGQIAVPEQGDAGQRSWTRLSPVLALGVLAALLLLRGFDVDPIARLRLLGFDFMQRLVPAGTPQGRSDVAIVAIDDASLAEIGQWPWPRDVMAGLVQEVDRGRARAIVFDILFAEPERSDPGNADAALADAIAESSAPVILSSALGRVGNGAIQGSIVLPPSLALDGPLPSGWVPTADGVIGNIVDVEQAAAGRGFLTTLSDGDGVLRRLPLVAQVGSNLQAGLVLETVRVALGAEQATIGSHPLFGVQSIAVGDHVIPTDESGALWFHDWPGDVGSRVARISAAELLAGRIDESALADRIVLVGTTATGLGDVATTSTGAQRSGVGVLAFGIQDALSGGFLSRPGYLHWLEILATLIVGLILTYRMTSYPAVRTAVWAGIAIVLVAGFSLSLLAFSGALIDPTFIVLTIIVIAAIGGLGRSREVERSRAAAQQSLADAAEFIHRLVEATFDSIIAVDRDGRLLFANRAAGVLPIFETAPAIGDDVMVLLRQDAPGDRMSGRDLVAFLANRGSGVDLVARSNATGEPILLEATATALRGEPAGAVVLVMRDVTARRRAQRQIEDQAAELAEMADDLQRRTDEAHLARAAAEHANAAKGEFLMTMSHELRTPLNAVIGFSELIASEPFGALGDERYRGYLADIRKSGGQLLSIIDSILEVVRLDRQDVAVHESPFALAQMIQESCAAKSLEIDAKSLTLTQELCDPDVQFLGDVTLMRHVVVSLLSNAIKYTDAEGQVTVRVVVEAGEGMTIAVSDTGVGMTAAELDRAGLMLEHSGDTMTRSHGGAGVGLALAKLATEKQGGRVRLSSTVGVGTTVEVWFPDSRIVWPGEGESEAASSRHGMARRAGTAH